MNANALNTVFQTQWRRSRAAIISASAGVFAIFAILLIRDRPLAYVADWNRETMAWELVPNESIDFIATMVIIFFTVIVPMIAVLFGNSDSDKLHVSLPTRVMRLPLATWKLVAVFMIYGLVAVGGISLFATALMKTVIATNFGWWMPLALAVSAIAVLQFWAYCFGNANPKAGAVVFGLGIAAVAWLLRQEFAFLFLNQAGPVATLSAVGGLLCMTYGATVWGVGVNRRGGFPDFVTELSQRRAARGKRLRRFRSPEQAHRWHERRLYGWQLPLLTLAIMTAYFFGMSILVAVYKISNVTGNSSVEGGIFDVGWKGQAPLVTTGLNLTAVTAGVLVGALMFMRAGTWNDESTYLLTRPLSTRTLAVARLVELLRTVLISLALMMVCTGAGALLLRFRGDGLQIIHYLGLGYEHVPPILALVFFWGMLFLALWVGIWSINLAYAMAIFGIAILPAFGIIWGLEEVGIISRSQMGTSLDMAFMIGSRVGAVVLIAGAAWAYIRAERLGVIPRYMKGVMLVFWLSYSLPFIYYGLTFNQEALVGVIYNDWSVKFPHPIDWGLWTGLSVMPIAPLFTHAYFLERARRQ